MKQPYKRQLVGRIAVSVSILITDHTRETVVKPES